VEDWPTVSDSVHTGVFEHKCWDPGLAGASKPIVINRFWVKFAPRAVFPWDPGSAREIVDAHQGWKPVTDKISTISVCTLWQAT
jgi:hypothetical protein